MKNQRKILNVCIIIILVSCIFLSFTLSPVQVSAKIDSSTVCVNEGDSESFTQDYCNITVDATIILTNYTIAIHIVEIDNGNITDLKIKIKFEDGTEREVEENGILIESYYYYLLEYMPEVPTQFVDSDDTIEIEIEVTSIGSSSPILGVDPLPDKVTTSSICLCRGPECPCPVPFNWFFSLLGILGLSSIYVLKKIKT